MTTKDSLVVDASGMEEVENFRDLTIPIEEKGKLKLDHADCKRMATSHIQVPVAAVNCALLPHHQFRPYLVEYVTRFVEAKYNVLLDREARKLMVSEKQLMQANTSRHPLAIYLATMPHFNGYTSPANNTPWKCYRWLEGFQL